MDKFKTVQTQLLTRIHQALGTDLPNQFKDVNGDLKKVTYLVDQGKKEAK